MENRAYILKAYRSSHEGDLCYCYNRQTCKWKCWSRREKRVGHDASIRAADYDMHDNSRSADYYNEEKEEEYEKEGDEDDKGDDNVCAHNDKCYNDDGLGDYDNENDWI